MHAGSRYADIRPYTVPESLSELAGPTSGIVTLPLSLDWSQQGRYDLGIDKDRRRLYETVIREAMDVSEVRRFLDEGLLLRLWPSLWLPVRVRSLWQERFPQLGSAAAA
ncbi:hypothetical protein [Streptomyces sp. CA2R106]|uniref:hypothetical protein n=1 Tax=Streptomyces sp. CA2R106 TaxID=3120153 RepID=UPI0030082B99